MGNERIEGAGPVAEATILLVDDEASIREIGQEILKRLHYKVLVAADGEQAVRLFKQYLMEIDLVIMDLVMPVMSGQEAFLQMKQLNPQMRVLFSSGYEADENFSLILNDSSSVGFIQKPYTMKELQRWLNTEFASRKPRTDLR